MKSFLTNLQNSISTNLEYRLSIQLPNRLDTVSKPFTAGGAVSLCTDKNTVDQSDGLESFGGQS